MAECSNVTIFFFISSRIMMQMPKGSFKRLAMLINTSQTLQLLVKMLQTLG